MRTCCGPLLKKLGHEVTVVGDGMEVLQMLQGTDFDVILMDIEMPKMNGMEASECIRNGLTGTKTKLFRLSP